MNHTSIDPADPVDRTLESANSSARMFRSVFVVYLIIAAYIALISLSVNDEILFRDGNLEVPVLEMSINISYYFMLAPWFFLLVHFNLFLQGIILSRKALDYMKEVRLETARRPGRDETAMLRLLLSIPLTQAVSAHSYSNTFRSMMVAFIFAALVAVPIAVLAFMQIRFLPVQSAITYWHWLAILVDLLMIRYFWPQLYTVMRTKGVKAKLPTIREPARVLDSSALTTFALFLIFFSDFALQIDPEISIRAYQHERLDETAGFFVGLQSRFIGFREFYAPYNLDLQNKKLYFESKSKPSEFCLDDDTQDRSMTLDLGGRSFMKARLSGAYLCSVSLESANLRDVELRGAWLHGAELSGADLEGANLQDAVLSGANLRKAMLQHSDLANAKLGDADLRRAELQGANLRRAELQGANLRRAELQGANLRRAELQGANLRRAELQGANLRRAELQGANLRDAELQGADLRDAELQGADLRDAELHGADLRGGELQGADLGGSKLQGANLWKVGVQGANLKGAELQGIVSSDDFPWPSGFVERMNSRIGEESDLGGIIFAGGLTDGDVNDMVDSMVDYVSEDRIEQFREDMRGHADGNEKIGVLPGGARFSVGEYGEEDARKWVSDYRKVMKSFDAE